MDNNTVNLFKKNSKKNIMNKIMNNFKSKTINITRVRNPSSKIKDNEKNIYERFHTKENIIIYLNIRLILLSILTNQK